jgi:hypothetical protein
MTTDNSHIGRVEGILEEVRSRLSSIENHIDGLESRTDSRFTSLESKMQTQFYWLLGVMLTMWITIILAVLLRL